MQHVLSNIKTILCLRIFERYEVVICESQQNIMFIRAGVNMGNVTIRTAILNETAWVEISGNQIVRLKMALLTCQLY